jgi:Protein of unknown function (DUF2721)
LQGKWQKSKQRQARGEHVWQLRQGQELRKAAFLRLGQAANLRNCFFATTENPYTVLTLIAAPAVFTNAASVLTLGTGNRLARVVDRTRVIAQELQRGELNTPSLKLWRSHLNRLERRGGLLLRGMRLFSAALGHLLQRVWSQFSEPVWLRRSTAPLSRHLQQ